MSDTSSSSASSYATFSGDVEEAKHFDKQGRFPTVWLVFCHILASLLVIMAIAVTCSVPMRISPDNGKALFAVSVLSILVSVAAGVCGPIAVVFASSKSVVAWTVVHSLLFVANTIFLIINLCYGSDIIIPCITGPMCALQLFFCLLYGPLISIKNLQRPPAGRCCRCTCYYD